MPIWKVRIERDYVVTEDFTRFVEAPTHDVAEELANSLADNASSDCPDDVSETGGGGAQPFYAMDIVLQDERPVGEEILMATDIPGAFD